MAMISLTYKDVSFFAEKEWLCFHLRVAPFLLLSQGLQEIYHETYRKGSILRTKPS